MVNQCRDGFVVVVRRHNLNCFGSSMIVVPRPLGEQDDDHQNAQNNQGVTQMTRERREQEHY